jgi:uncharacterized membrane protein YhaH (DUF805 family)
MKKKWFREKNYGWGWYPATWEGWMVLLVFLILIILNSFRLHTLRLSTQDFLFQFISETFILVIILLVICYKTGEKPHWNWGKKNN